LDVDDPSKGELFDGSPTSMGSDGAPVKHEGIQILEYKLPAGTGGGCVMRGPFSNMTVHLGPIGVPDVVEAADPSRDNPRCLRRDLNGAVAARFSSFRNTTEVILGCEDIATFQGIAQGDPRVTDKDHMGIHGGGHYTIGGDPGSDLWLSPGDPMFYLHHGQMDRVYWIWQNLDWANRQVRFHPFAAFLPSRPSRRMEEEEKVSGRLMRDLDRISRARAPC
jgi:tyrosinase